MDRVLGVGVVVGGGRGLTAISKFGKKEGKGGIEWWTLSSNYKGRMGLLCHGPGGLHAYLAKMAPSMMLLLERTQTDAFRASDSVPSATLSGDDWKMTMANEACGMG